MTRNERAEHRAKAALIWADILEAWKLTGNADRVRRGEIEANDGPVITVICDQILGVKA